MQVCRSPWSKKKTKKNIQNTKGQIPTYLQHLQLEPAWKIVNICSGDNICKDPPEVIESTDDATNVLTPECTPAHFTCKDDKFGKSSGECSFKLDFGCPVKITAVELINADSATHSEVKLAMRFLKCLISNLWRCK